MKRLIACAALLLAAAGVFVALTARADQEPDFRIDNSLIGEVVSPAESLREQVLERLRAKVELMSEEELRETLEATDTEIRTMQAKQKLDQTAETLQEIVEEFEGTPSADTALAMMQVYGNHGRPTPVGGDAPFYGTPSDPVPLSRPVPTRPGRSPQATPDDSTRDDPTSFSSPEAP